MIIYLIIFFVSCIKRFLFLDLNCIFIFYELLGKLVIVIYVEMLYIFVLDR